MLNTEWRVGPGADGMRLDKYLADALRLGSRGRAVAALDRGKIFVNEVEATLADGGRRLVQGDIVRIWIDRPGSSRRRNRTGPVGNLDIVYEDDALMVVNKPAGVLTVPLERRPDVSSVFDYIEQHLRSQGGRRPFAVHRIDQDTSGLVVFAKSADAQRVLQGQFRRREPDRVYWAVVYGTPDPPSGVWRDVLVWDEKSLIQKQTRPTDPKGNEAVSEYRVVESFGVASLVEVCLRTGRRNQIRIQAQLHGHTLVGEERYIIAAAPLRPIDFRRQALHAKRLTLRHPTDGQRLEFEAPLPRDFVDLLTRLRRHR